MSSFISDFNKYCQDSEECKKAMENLKELIKKEKRTKIEKNRKSKETLEKEFKDLSTLQAKLKKEYYEIRDEREMIKIFIAAEGEKLSKPTFEELSNMISQLEQDEKEHLTQLTEIDEKLDKIIKERTKTKKQHFETPYGTVDIMSSMFRW